MTENFEVVTAYDGESACEKFFADTYSIVLLDLMIPKISGMEVMKTIRASSTVPIIILSAKDTDSDKTLGLGLGADDYVAKPFSVTEVLARIKANIRRTTQYTAPAVVENDIITKGELELNTSDYSVMKNGEKIELTVKEFEILKLLMKIQKKSIQRSKCIRRYGMTLIWVMRMRLMFIGQNAAKSGVKGKTGYGFD